MDGLKQGLADIAKRLEDLVTRARTLRNQNFADIATSAKGRVQQLIDHPDLELVQKERDDKLPFDPKAGSEIGGLDAADLNGDGAALRQAPNLSDTQPDVRK